LAVPSDFVRDWLVRRFAKRIEETLAQFLGRSITLSFQAVTPAHSVPAEEMEEAVAPLAENYLGSPRRGFDTEHSENSVGAEAPDTPDTAAKPSARPLREMTGLEDFSSSPLNRKYTFENFIVGRSNYISHAAAWAVANAPAKGQYNPLFIYGGVGLGKMESSPQATAKPPPKGFWRNERWKTASLSMVSVFQ